MAGLEDTNHVHSNDNKQLGQKDEQLQTVEIRNKEANESQAECRIQLYQLNTKLRDSEMRRKRIDDENKRLFTDIHLCQSEMKKSKELAYTTKIRQLKDEEMSDEIKSLILHLEGEMVVMRENSYYKQNSNFEESSDGGEKKLSIPDHLKRLQEIYQPLTEKIEAKKVAALMFQYDALAIKELQEVHHGGTPIEAAQHLLQVIMNIPEQCVYECFLDVLKELEQHDIWSWLLYPDYDISSAHVALIQIHYSYLVDNIDARNGLIDELYSREVIDCGDFEDLDATSSSSECNASLLSILGRKSEQQFEHFMEVLRQTDHKHVFHILRGCEVESSPEPTDQGINVITISSLGSASVVAVGVPRPVEVGPIWNNTDSFAKACQYLSEHPGEAWTGHWFTTVPCQMSVLSLVKYDDKHIEYIKDVEVAGPCTDDTEAGRAAQSYIHGYSEQNLAWTGHYEEYGNFAVIRIVKYHA